MFLKKTLSKIFATAALAVSLAATPMMGVNAQEAQAQPTSASTQQQVIQELEPRRYYTAAQISAHLQAAGHQPVVFMNIELLDIENPAIVKRSALLTSDRNGNWYLLQGNAEQGQATHFALGLQGTNLQTHDYRTRTLPDFVNRDYDRSQFRTEASNIAQQMGMSMRAVFYDDAIENVTVRSDLSIVLQGDLPNGGLITLAADPDNGDFSVVNTYPGRGGVTSPLGSGKDFSVSRQLLTRFDAEKDTDRKYVRVSPGTRQP